MSRKIPNKFLSLASGSALTLILTGTSAAQTTTLDEIIVTAQKREQSIQDVPVAVSAFDENFLKSRDITSIDGLSSLAPNLKIEKTPGNSTAAQIAIRGGVTINPALTWEPTVGIYLNGAYIGKTQGSIFDVADIERMEVLRGPQGTLYGRNTLAGAINIITAEPDEEYGGDVELSYGNYDYKRAKATINSGQIGPFRASIAGLLERRDGFVENVPNQVPGVLAARPIVNDEFESINRNAVLATVSADLADNLDLTYAFDFSTADQDSTYSQLVRVADNNIFDPNSPAYIGFPGPGGVFFGFPLDQFVNEDRQTEVSSDFPNREFSRIQGHNLSAAYDFGAAEFRSITSFRKMDWIDSLDLDGSPMPLAHVRRESDYDSFSQEFQLVGGNDRLNYLLGLYYFEDDGFTNNPQSFFAGASVFDSRYGFTTEARAAFAQLDFALTDKLTLTGGLRYTEEDKTIERTNIAVAFQGLPPNTPFVPAGTTAETSFDDLTPTIALDYAASEQVNLYARYAQGFKSGGFNGEAGSVAETIRPYQSEVVDSFEIGAKTRFADGRAQVNFAAFLNKHENMQLSVFTAQGAAASDIRNAGGADIWGIEVDAVVQLSDDVRFRSAIGTLSTNYTEFIELGVDVSDDRVFPHAPGVTGSMGLDWTAIRGNWGELQLSGDMNYSASYFLYPYSTDPQAGQFAGNSQADARTVFDARATLRDLSFGPNNVELTAWVRNLTDEEYTSNFIDFGAGFGGLTVGYFGPPRTYGLTLSLGY